ncbi:hypothetical protein F5B19DRAFT_143465 [Rostrohypoxylon terebratum]|nr:hypothetical protein F5B19DRAFT_143465 [Rostrohypoxylon terebratum]
MHSYISTYWVVVLHYHINSGTISWRYRLTRSKRSFYCRLLLIDINYLILPLARIILLVASHIVCDCQARLPPREIFQGSRLHIQSTSAYTSPVPSFVCWIYTIPSYHQTKKRIKQSGLFLLLTTSLESSLPRHIIIKQNYHSASYLQSCSY